MFSALVRARVPWKHLLGSELLAHPRAVACSVERRGFQRPVPDSATLWLVSPRPPFGASVRTERWRRGWWQAEGARFSLLARSALPAPARTPALASRPGSRPPGGSAFERSRAYTGRRVERVCGRPPFLDHPRTGRHGRGPTPFSVDGTGQSGEHIGRVCCLESPSRSLMTQIQVVWEERQGSSQHTCFHVRRGLCVAVQRNLLGHDQKPLILCTMNCSCLHTST